MKYPFLFFTLNHDQLRLCQQNHVDCGGHVTWTVKDRYRRIAQGSLGSVVIEPAVVLPCRGSFNPRMGSSRSYITIRSFGQYTQYSYDPSDYFTPS
jgi:hypothetical protein